MSRPPMTRPSPQPRSEVPLAAPPPRWVLALDTASPVVSLALGDERGIVGERTLALRRSSESLLPNVAELLSDGGVALAELAGVVVLRGPGSFTGLRVGLATALGFHQAIGLRATALSTLEVLAAAAGPSAGEEEIVAAVDALRGDWTVQRFRSADDRPAAVSEPTRLPATALSRFAPCRLIGFGVGVLSQEAWWVGGRMTAVEPPPLAPTAVRLAAAGPIAWDPGLLTRPIYFRPPATTPPRPG